MLFSRSDSIKRIAVYSVYLTLIGILFLASFWMVAVYNIQKRTQQYLSKSEHFSLLYDLSKVRTRGFPASFLLAVNDPRLCLSPLKECIQLSSIQFRANFFARKLIISVLFPAEPHINSFGATEIKLTADLNQPVVAALCRFKNMFLTKTIRALAVDARYYSNHEPFHARFVSNKTLIGNDLQGWRTTIDTDVEGHRIKAFADSVFYSRNNFYIDFKRVDIMAPGYELSMEGAWAFYNNSNHGKIIADISNMENFTKTVWRNIKFVLKNRPFRIDNVEDIIAEQCIQQIIEETEPIDNGRRMTIRSEGGVVLIGVKNISKLLYGAIYDYIGAIPQR